MREIITTWECSAALFRVLHCQRLVFYGAGCSKALPYEGQTSKVHRALPPSPSKANTRPVFLLRGPFHHFLRRRAILSPWRTKLSRTGLCCDPRPRLLAGISNRMGQLIPRSRYVSVRRFEHVINTFAFQPAFNLLASPEPKALARRVNLKPTAVSLPFEFLLRTFVFITASSNAEC